MATNAARRLAALTKRLGQIDQVIVTTAGQAVHDALMDQLQRDAHGGALSGIAKGRYRLDVDITPLRNPAGVRIRPKAKQFGMWTLLDSGRTGGYTVAARNRRKHKAGVKRGSSRAAAMRTAGGWAAGPYTVHRSTSGKHTWARGRDAGFAAALPEVRRRLHEVVTGG